VLLRTPISPLVLAGASRLERRMGEAALRLSRIVFLGNLRSPGQLINLGARWGAGWRGPGSVALKPLANSRGKAWIAISAGISVRFVEMVPKPPSHACQDNEQA